MIIISKKTLESLITALVSGSTDPLWVPRPERQPDPSGTPVAWFRLLKIRMSSAPRNLGAAEPDRATFEAAFGIFIPSAVGEANAFALSIAQNAVKGLLYGQRIATSSDGTYEGWLDPATEDDEVEPAGGDGGVNRGVQMGVVLVGGQICRTV